MMERHRVRDNAFPDIFFSPTSREKPEASYAAIFPAALPRHTRRIFHATPHTGCGQIYEQRNTLEWPLPFRRYYDRIRVSKS